MLTIIVEYVAINWLIVPVIVLATAFIFALITAMGDLCGAVRKGTDLNFVLGLICGSILAGTGWFVLLLFKLAREFVRLY